MKQTTHVFGGPPDPLGTPTGRTGNAPRVSALATNTRSAATEPIRPAGGYQSAVVRLLSAYSLRCSVRYG
jgi:hypothetical protein